MMIRIDDVVFLWLFPAGVVVDRVGHQRCECIDMRLVDEKLEVRGDMLDIAQK